MFNYNNILKNKDISRNILEDMYPNEIFSSEEREEKSLKDIDWTLRFIVEAIQVENEIILENYFIWLHRLFKGLEIDKIHIVKLFKSIQIILNQTYHDQELNSFLNKIEINKVLKENITSKINPYQNSMEEYLNALLLSDRNKAKSVVDKLISKGTKIEDIYLYIFQDAMSHVGNLWHDSIITVGREHYCTAVTQFLMSNLYTESLFEEEKDKTMIACAVGSDLHEMGIRMVSDIFELHGWRVSFLGSNLPTEELVSFAKETNPNLIALSITMPYHISILKNTISSIKLEEKLKNIPIIVGGVPFIDNPDLYKSVGADAYAKDALEGVEIAKRLLQ
ncbi:MAG: cobalamin-dependent protein [Tenericutes bacterium]|nr:cobalamin-dependent protein [Mycoplasmatota bacterium]